MGDEDGDEDELTAAAFKAKCGCWWAPRQPALGGRPEPATFEAEVRCCWMALRGVRVPCAGLCSPSQLTLLARTLPARPHAGGQP